MRVLTEQVIKAIDALRLDAWWIHQIKLHVAKHGSETNSIDDDIETAKMIIEEKSFEEEIEYETNDDEE